MENVLTSWKSIAQYVDKGVRTVQRWEEHFGFPVRRPMGKGHRAVLAIPEEIDAWILSQGQARRSELEQLRAEVAQRKAEVERLRAEVAQLKAEVERLRAEVERLRAELRGSRHDPSRYTAGSQSSAA